MAHIRSPTWCCTLAKKHLDSRSLPRRSSGRVIVAFCVPREHSALLPGALRVIMFYAKESAGLSRRHYDEKAATWQRSAAASKHRRGRVVGLFSHYHLSKLQRVYRASRIASVPTVVRNSGKALLRYTTARNIRANYFQACSFANCAKIT